MDLARYNMNEKRITNKCSRIFCPFFTYFIGKLNSICSNGFGFCIIRTMTYTPLQKNKTILVVILSAVASFTVDHVYEPILCRISEPINWVEFYVCILLCAVVLYFDFFFQSTIRIISLSVVNHRHGAMIFFVFCLLRFCNSVAHSHFNFASFFFSFLFAFHDQYVSFLW